MLKTLSTRKMALHENATMTFPVLILTLVCCSCGTSTMANEIATRNNLYRRAVEVYLRQHNEMDFEQFQLTYLPSADGSGTIGISICDYPNITQPTRAQLIAFVPRAKQRLARLEKRDRRREKIRSGKTCRLLFMCSRVAFTPRRRHGPRSPCKKKAKQHSH